MVPYRLVPAIDPRGVFQAPGAVWAEADIGAAAAHLRRLADDAAARGGAGGQGAGCGDAPARPGPACGCVARHRLLRLLVWQWGRRGGRPALCPGTGTGAAADARRDRGALALQTGGDHGRRLAGVRPSPWTPMRAWLVGRGGWLASPSRPPALARQLRPLQLDGAMCAMPAPLDLLMAVALRRAALPYAVAVHDATLHPGDILPMQAVLQRRLLRHATALVGLSGHVAGQLARIAGGRPLFRSRLSPLAYGCPGDPPRSHGGPLRLLSFGRLLPYKGLDLLAAAIPGLPRGKIELRVVGAGPESAELAALRRLPGVTVENRWVPEDEVGGLLCWADALVLSHREAQVRAGVAAAALAAGAMGRRHTRGRHRGAACRLAAGPALRARRRITGDGDHQPADGPAALPSPAGRYAVAGQRGRARGPVAAGLRGRARPTTMRPVAASQAFLYAEGTDRV